MRQEVGSREEARDALKGMLGNGSAWQEVSAKINQRGEVLFVDRERKFTACINETNGVWGVSVDGDYF